MGRTVVLMAFLLIVLSSCQGAKEQGSTKNGVKEMEIKVTSKSFKEGEMIPAKFTCDGDDISPDIAWDKIPEGTKSFAIIADDPDAPHKTWVHWVIFNISPDKKELLEHMSSNESLLNGAKQGVNDFGKTGYNGPCPPPGNPHRYYFKVYALDSVLQLGPRAQKPDLVKAMEGHVIGHGELMGKYARK